MIKVYRKTATIKAEQFNYEKWVHMRHDAYPMVFGDTAKDGGMMATNPVIKTLEGYMRINDNDWIATGVNGEHWPISDDVFKKTYAELPVIPSYVAEYIDAAKNNQTRLNDPNIAEAIVDVVEYGGGSIELFSWIECNGDAFARAWLDGYVVEADK